MKSKIINLLIVGAVFAVVGSSVPVQAIATPISGAISFSDQFTANGPLNTATALTSITGVRVSSTAGDYTLGTIVNGSTPVSFAGVTAGTPFTFNPIPGSAFPGFWSIIVGGTTYSFDVLTTTYDVQTSQTLTLQGTGIAYITGAITRAPTPGNWNLTLNANGGLLNFSGGVNSPVPDGGTTVLLLGAALSALGLIKRRLA